MLLNQHSLSISNSMFLFVSNYEKCKRDKLSSKTKYHSTSNKTLYYKDRKINTQTCSLALKQQI